MREQGYNHAPPDRLRHRKPDLGMDQEAHSMDFAHGSIPHTQRIDPKAPIPHMASTKKSNIMGTCAYGVV